MRLMSYDTRAGASFGIVDGKRVFDLGKRLGGDLLSALRAESLGRGAASVRGGTADFWTDEVAFLPVIPNPGKIVCVGLNYLEHRLEGNHAATTVVPALFTRFPESQTGHLRPLVCPQESNQFDFEAELAVIIGKVGRRIPEASALILQVSPSTMTDPCATGSTRLTNGRQARTFPPLKPSDPGW
jgi:2-keto-4-pentenoate hydratase/2-oxohepta-3-ene-1,7-dioic acid hydratase in catechol pathway